MHMRINIAHGLTAVYVTYPPSFMQEVADTDISITRKFLQVCASESEGFHITQVLALPTSHSAPAAGEHPFWCLPKHATRHSPLRHRALPESFQRRYNLHGLKGIVYLLIGCCTCLDPESFEPDEDCRCTNVQKFSRLVRKFERSVTSVQEYSKIYW